MIFGNHPMNGADPGGWNNVPTCLASAMKKVKEA